MGRLTKRIPNPERGNIVVYTMGAYEDTTAGEMTGNDIRTVLRALANYEDLEEQGLLLKLPCKVGDTLYHIDTDEEIKNAEIEHLTIDNIVICKDGDVLFKYDACDGVICHLKNIITDKPYLDFYRIFLTQAEAEEALEKIKNK